VSSGAENGCRIKGGRRKEVKAFGPLVIEVFTISDKSFWTALESLEERSRKGTLHTYRHYALIQLAPCSGVHLLAVNGNTEQHLATGVAICFGRFSSI